jgi:hypothetical protein
LQRHEKRNSHARIVRIVLDGLSRQALDIEDQPVQFHRLRTNLADQRDDCLDCVVHAGEQVDVLRRSRPRPAPRREHKRAFEDELSSMWRLSETVQKPLHCEILEQLLKGPISFFRLAGQPLPNRCG